jgi:proteic killer suppression protein
MKIRLGMRSGMILALLYLRADFKGIGLPLVFRARPFVVPDAWEGVSTADFFWLKPVLFCVTIHPMIEGFRCRETGQLWKKGTSRRFNGVAKVALRKLAMLDAAERLEDLRAPPANRLEALKGKRKGQFSIRINDQCRICFEWKDGRVLNVEITDYH